MAKRVMKQRVSLGLFSTTVLLASIVGASVPRVPSGETTAFPSNPLGPWNPSPSSDQYTPQFRDPPKYRGMVAEEEEEEEGKQDDRGAWIRDSRPRMNPRNHEENKSGPEIDLPPNNEFFNNHHHHHHHRNLGNDLRTKGESSRIDAAEAMRLSSLKVAFDEPIEVLDEIEASKEDEGGDMQGDEFLGDAAFEDEGPGSVEVYKLDLFKDAGPVTGPRLSRRKSKAPKKAAWKISPSKDSNGELTSKTDRKEEIPASSSSRRGSSLKQRIFGTGGVPELQVGCEGVEGSQQREKRSGKENEKAIKNSPPKVYENEDDLDYELEEYYDLIDGPEDPRYSGAVSSRGDMNPMVKTPVDSEVRKILLKGRLPKRGDLGDAWEESFADVGRTVARKEVRAKRSPRKNRTGKRKNNRRGKRHGGKKNRLRNFIGKEKKKQRELIDPEKISIDLNDEQKFRRAREQENNDRKLAEFIGRITPIRIPKNQRKSEEENRLLPFIPIPPYDPYASERTRLIEEERTDDGKIYTPKYAALTNRERSTISRPLEIREKPFVPRSPEELERLNKLPVSATIVINATKSEIDSESKNNEIPNSVQNGPTSSTPVPKPTAPPCVWANINCCSNFKPLENCFIENGCAEKLPDNPCSEEKLPGALAELLKYLRP